MTITVNELFDKIINERSQIINQHDYKLFSNFKIINKSPFVTVRIAKWGNSIVVLKSLNIDTEEIISTGIIAEITKIISNKTIPKTILNEAITNKTIADEAITNETIIINEAITNKIITNEAITNETIINNTITNETITNGAIINETTNEKFVRLFINELQNLVDIEKHKHPNIIQFFGVTKNSLNNQYNLILQFAVNGNLREYLKKNFSNLKWSDKLRYANEIAEGLSFLHSNGIFHRDLHSKNILVHNGSMLIADFGLSKHIDEVTMVKTGGMYGYLEPRCFVNFQYKCDNKSDIYSFGVILWELSSGRPPFCGFENQIAIIYHVLSGNREAPIEDTPSDYVKLYRNCWDQDPKVRPEIEDVLRKLKNIRPSLTDYKNISHEKWIEHKINAGFITKYKFDEFIEFKLIGSGAFSLVYKAILKNTENSYALKIIHNNKYTDKEIVNEIKHIISVGFHETIIKFYGVSKYKDQMDPSVVKNVLVLEYADSGTLRDYLNNNATKIGWKLKILFANQLVDAVKWLHACNIIHGDLHPNNILVHQQALKLADFGISRRIAESSESRTTSEIFGVIPYIDPQCFLINNSQNGGLRRYKKTKKSDIYSVGVMLWEISSEKTPFKDDKDNATLPLRIFNGLREKPIFDTHHKYVAIYKKCWQGMQDDRPSIQEVAMELKDIIIQDIDVQDINIQDISNDKLFDISDINNFVKYLDFHFNNQDVTNNSDEQETQDVTNNSDEQETQDVTNNSDEQETRDVTNNSDEQETHDVTDNSETQKVTNELEDDDMTIFVNKLYSTLSKLFNEGRSVSDIIINSISDGGKTNEEVFNWLSTHDDNPKYICLLGLFYSLEIGTKKGNVDVFNLFLNAASSNDIIAQYFVGRCYEIGWSTNMKKAIEWYTKASQGGCTIAECMLGEYCYKLHKYEQAFKLLKSAADKGNALAMNTLGICYSKGYGTKVDNVKGFKSFEKAAKMGLPASQYELGNCYEYGNGTIINLETSLYWYQKASEKNSNYLNHVKRVENRIE